LPFSKGKLDAPGVVGEDGTRNKTRPSLCKECEENEVVVNDKYEAKLKGQTVR
jgi:hypothetical protein